MSVELWQKDWKGNREGEMKADKACYTNRLLNEDGNIMKDKQKIHRVNRLKERKTDNNSLLDEKNLRSK